MKMKLLFLVSTVGLGILSLACSGRSGDEMFVLRANGVKMLFYSDSGRFDGWPRILLRSDISRAISHADIEIDDSRRQVTIAPEGEHFVRFIFSFEVEDDDVLIVKISENDEVAYDVAYGLIDAYSQEYSDLLSIVNDLHDVDIPNFVYSVKYGNGRVADIDVYKMFFNKTTFHDNDFFRSYVLVPIEGKGEVPGKVINTVTKNSDGTVSTSTRLFVYVDEQWFLYR